VPHQSTFYISVLFPAELFITINMLTINYLGLSLTSKLLHLFQRNKFADDVLSLQLTHWSTVFYRKPRVSHLVKRYKAFIEPPNCKAEFTRGRTAPFSLD
jgi:hypothetical protein